MGCGCLHRGVPHGGVYRGVDRRGVYREAEVWTSPVWRRLTGTRAVRILLECMLVSFKQSVVSRDIVIYYQKTNRT